jgi:hypothetical protein
VRADVPEELAAVVQRMMARRPEDRYAIPLLVVGALRQFATGVTPRPTFSPSPAPPKPATIINLATQPTESRGR